jgi:hypothetical protein
VEGKDLGHSDISRVVVSVYHTVLYLWTSRYWIGRSKSQQQIRLADGRHCLGQEDIRKHTAKTLMFKHRYAQNGGTPVSVAKEMSYGSCDDNIEKSMGLWTQL